MIQPILSIENLHTHFLTDRGEVPAVDGALRDCHRQHSHLWPAGPGQGLTVLGSNLMGDGLRDVLDPRMKN